MFLNFSSLFLFGLCGVLQTVMGNALGIANSQELTLVNCKEIDENNKIGKNRDLFKKFRATNGTFHGKMGTIKDRNSMDLTEAEDSKNR